MNEEKYGRPPTRRNVPSSVPNTRIPRFNNPVPPKTNEPKAGASIASTGTTVRKINAPQIIPRPKTQLKTYSSARNSKIATPPAPPKTVQPRPRLLPLKTREPAKAESLSVSSSGPYRPSTAIPRAISVQNPIKANIRPQAPQKVEQNNNPTLEIEENDEEMSPKSTISSLPSDSISKNNKSYTIHAEKSETEKPEISQAIEEEAEEEELISDQVPFGEIKIVTVEEVCHEIAQSEVLPNDNSEIDKAPENKLEFSQNLENSQVSCEEELEQTLASIQDEFLECEENPLNPIFPSLIKTIEAIRSKSVSIDSPTCSLNLLQESTSGPKTLIEDKESVLEVQELILEEQEPQNKETSYWETLQKSLGFGISEEESQPEVKNVVSDIDTSASLKIEEKVIEKWREITSEDDLNEQIVANTPSFNNFANETSRDSEIFSIESTQEIVESAFGNSFESKKRKNLASFTAGEKFIFSLTDIKEESIKGSESESQEEIDKNESLEIIEIKRNVEKREELIPSQLEIEINPSTNDYIALQAKLSKLKKFESQIEKIDHTNENMADTGEIYKRKISQEVKSVKSSKNGFGPGSSRVKLKLKKIKTTESVSKGMNSNDYSEVEIYNGRSSKQKISERDLIDQNSGTICERNFFEPRVKGSACTLRTCSFFPIDPYRLLGAEEERKESLLTTEELKRLFVRRTAPSFNLSELEKYNEEQENENGLSWTRALKVPQNIQTAPFSQIQDFLRVSFRRREMAHFPTSVQFFYHQSGNRGLFAYLQITNITESYITFRVRSSASGRYLLSPQVGEIISGGFTSIFIETAQNSMDFEEMKKDTFLVEIMPISRPHVQTVSLINLWSRKEVGDVAHQKLLNVTIEEEKIESLNEELSLRNTMLLEEKNRLRQIIESEQKAESEWSFLTKLFFTFILIVIGILIYYYYAQIMKFCDPYIKSFIKKQEPLPIIPRIEAWVESLNLHKRYFV